MSDFLIELVGAQFKRAYLLYVIEIRHKQGTYFYVGQTGDNRYITARPAFRRLAGHLEDIGQSTQNQVYRDIAVNILKYRVAERKATFPEEIKLGVETFLVNSTVRMHVYVVEPFEHLVSKLNHLATVRRITQLENFVLQSFRDSGRYLMNRRFKHPMGDCPYPDVLERVKSDFSL